MGCGTHYDLAITQEAVRRRLAVEEAEQMAAGVGYILDEEISASQLIVMGLDFEEQQYVCCEFFILHLGMTVLGTRRRYAVDVGALGVHATDDQKTRLQTRANILRRKIDSWIEVQHLYIPGLRLMRIRDENNAPSSQPVEEPVNDIKLYLPSSITIACRVACDLRLCQMEWDLRVAQANDALDDLRDALRLRSYVYKDKDRFQKGIARNTRSRGIIDRIEVKMNAAAARYRTARAALSGLAIRSNQGDWSVMFPPLKDGDIRGMSEADDAAPSRGGRPSEGRRAMSWIWHRLGVVSPDTEETVHEGESRH